MYASLTLGRNEEHDSPEVGRRKTRVGAVLHEEEFCDMPLAERVRVFDLCSTDFVEVIEDEYGGTVPPSQHKESAPRTWIASGKSRCNVWLINMDDDLKS